jgi:hypothetical protein
MPVSQSGDARGPCRHDHSPRRKQAATWSSREAPGAAGLDPHGPQPSARRALYLKLLNWCFAGFNSTRIVTYVPTMWAIHVSGDSSQHSMLTWLAWVGANSSMAAWLYEHNGRRFDKAVAVNVGNALMCLLTCALIAWYRR